MILEVLITPTQRVKLLNCVIIHIYKGKNLCFERCCAGVSLMFLIACTEVANFITNILVNLFLMQILPLNVLPIRAAIELSLLQCLCLPWVYIKICLF